PLWPAVRRAYRVHSALHAAHGELALSMDPRTRQPRGTPERFPEAAPMAVRPGRIGLLGGSFDPVHTAHIALAKSARSTLDLDQVQLIPAANPWQREPLKASSQHRLAMLDLAIKRCNWLAINTIEIDRG